MSRPLSDVANEVSETIIAEQTGNKQGGPNRPVTLFRRAGSPGEQAAAGAAIDRLRGRLRAVSSNPEIELKFSRPPAPETIVPMDPRPNI